MVLMKVALSKAKNAGLARIVGGDFNTGDRKVKYNCYYTYYLIIIIITLQ